MRKFTCSCCSCCRCHVMWLSTATKDNESLAAIKSCNLINLSIKQGKSSRYLPLYTTLSLSPSLFLSPSLLVFLFFRFTFSATFPALALKANFISISKWRRGESIMLLIGSLMGAAYAYNTRGVAVVVAAASDACRTMFAPRGN